MAQLIQFTLRHGPTVQTEMSLATGGIHYMICQRLSGATEDCSIVRGRQLQTLSRQRCCMSASLRMFGSLWNTVAAHEHRRQDGSRRPGTVVKCQTATGVRVWPPKCRLHWLLLNATNVTIRSRSSVLLQDI